MTCGAAVLGTGGTPSGAVSIPKNLFMVFVVFAAASFLFGQLAAVHSRYLPMAPHTHSLPLAEAHRPDMTPLLRGHFEQCDAALGRLHRWYCLAEEVNAFLAPRFVTTLVLVSLAVVLGALLSL